MKHSPSKGCEDDVLEKSHPFKSVDFVRKSERDQRLRAELMAESDKIFGRCLNF